jgi:hypothetical protein
MPYVIAIGAAVMLVLIVFRAGRRSGYDAGRADERKEWSAKIREVDGDDSRGS